jgi:hypothetical protein
VRAGGPCTRASRQCSGTCQPHQAHSERYYAAAARLTHRDAGVDVELRVGAGKGGQLAESGGVGAVLRLQPADQHTQLLAVCGTRYSHNFVVRTGVT